MKILTRSVKDVDEMWDDVNASFMEAYDCYDTLMNDFDGGGEIDPVNKKNLSWAFEGLLKNIEVFRMETGL